MKTTAFVILATQVLAHSKEYRSLIRTANDGSQIPMSCYITEGTYLCVNEAQHSKVLTEEEPDIPLTKGETITNIVLALVLTMCSGLMSGLTVGLAAIDRLSLEVEATGNPEIKK